MAPRRLTDAQRAAKNAYKRRKSLERRLREGPPLPPHATVERHWAGCRCGRCSRAAMEHLRVAAMFPSVEHAAQVLTDPRDIAFWLLLGDVLTPELYGRMFDEEAS